MPFTLAHPAAVLPLARRLRGRTVFSALVIGSLVPDLPKLFPRLGMPPDTHHFSALVAVCVPVGLVVYVLFHALLARPLATLLPDGPRARLAPYLHDPARYTSTSLARVAFSLFLGGVTHLLWDAFTHPGMAGVDAFAVLQEPWLQIGVLPYPGYRVLQAASTILGLGVLARGSWRWLKQEPASEAPAPVALDPWRAATLGGLVGIVLGFALHAGLARTQFSAGFHGWTAGAQPAAVAAVEGLVIAALVFSAAWHAAGLAARLRPVRGGASR